MTVMSFHMFVEIKNIKAMFFSQFFNLQLLVQSVPITTKIVSSHPIHGEVYSMQHYVMQFLSNLRGTRFPPPKELTATI